MFRVSPPCRFLPPHPVTPFSIYSLSHHLDPSVDVEFVELVSSPSSPLLIPLHFTGQGVARSQPRVTRRRSTPAKRVAALLLPSPSRPRLIRCIVCLLALLAPRQRFPAGFCRSGSRTRTRDDSPTLFYCFCFSRFRDLSPVAVSRSCSFHRACARTAPPVMKRNTQRGFSANSGTLNSWTALLGFRFLERTTKTDDL